MKPCPFCAEEIQEAAIKCRFCGEFLPGTNQENPGEGREREPEKVAAEQSAAPPLLPVPDSPPFRLLPDLGPSSGSSNLPWWNRPIEVPPGARLRMGVVGVIAILILVVFGRAFEAQHRMAVEAGADLQRRDQDLRRMQRNVQALQVGPPLQVVNWDFRFVEGSEIEGRGLVKNVSSTPQHDVIAVMRMKNSVGDVIGEEFAPVDQNPIQPGRVASFTVRAEYYSGGSDRYIPDVGLLSFRRRGGERIPTVRR